jgi:hypothetical protein
VIAGGFFEFTHGWADFIHSFAAFIHSFAAHETALSTFFLKKSPLIHSFNQFIHRRFVDEQTVQASGQTRG